MHRWRNEPPPAGGNSPPRSKPTHWCRRRDSNLRQSRVEELSRRIPHARFASMNCTHDGHEERPSEFLVQVEPFISWFAKH